MHRCARTLVAAAVTTAALVAAAPTAQATPPIPDLSTQYWFGNYRISEVWATGARGQGITVAVLDSGVQADRPELRGVVLPGTDFAGGDGRTDHDPRGHGTAMAMLIAGQGGGPNDLTGIAPAARILPVFDDESTPQRLADGITWAQRHGARIVNISESGDGVDYPGSCPPEVAAAVRDVVGRGAIVVASAGNKADQGNPAEYPASCPGVVAVGAVDGAKRPWPESERQPYVDVAAPGVHMFSQNLDGEAGYSDGTSDATALVSAAAALVWSKFPTLTNRQVVGRLLATVTDDAATPGRDDVTGYGLVRPLFAITRRIPANAPNPVFDELDRTAPPRTAPPSTTPARTAGTAPSTGSPRATPVAASGGGSAAPTVLIVAGALLALLVLAGGLALARRRGPAG